LVGSLPTTTGQFAVAIGAELLLFLIVTAAVWSSPKPGIWLYAYAALLGALFLHVFTHVAQAVVVQGYVPGLVSAILVILPGALYIYKRLFETKLLTLRSAAFAAMVGILLFIPGVILFQQIGRFIH
jgi:hypothetical protein